MKRLLQMITVISIIFTYINVVFADPSQTTGTSVQSPGGESSANTSDTGSTSDNNTSESSASTPVKAVPKPTDIDAGAYILIDMKSGQVLLENNSKERHYPASTTKMLTAALACEKGSMDQMMTASADAVNDIGKDGMNIGISPGEQVSLYYLLHALLISSANETANIIAENICSTRQEFVDMMNQKAAELGCEGTHFVNPCGAHNDQHYTTAADLAKIARYGMGFKIFRDIVGTISYKMPATNKHTEWPVLYTTNKLLRYQKSDAIYKVIGIKTGYTGQAGNNLVSAAENSDGMELLAVVMDVFGENSSNKVIKFSRELYDYGFSNFSEKQLMKKGQNVQKVAVTDAAEGETLDLIAADDFKYVAEIGKEDQSLSGKPVINANITAPVKQGDVLGYFQYEKNGTVLGKIDLVAAKAVNKKEPTVIENVANTVKTGNPLKLVIIISLCVIVFLFLLRITLKYISGRLRKRRSKF